MLLTYIYVTGHSKKPVISKNDMAFLEMIWVWGVFFKNDMFWIANLKMSLCFANHTNGQAESNVISKNDMAFLEMTVLGCFFLKWHVLDSKSKNEFMHC